MSRIVRPVFIRWLLSYFALFLFSISVGAAVFAVMARTITQQQLDLNRGILLRAREQIELGAETLRDVAVQLTLEPTILELSRGDAEIPRRQNVLIRDAVLLLRRIDSAHPVVGGIDIVLPRLGLVFSPEGYIDIGEWKAQSARIAVRYPIEPVPSGEGEAESQAGWIVVSMNDQLLNDWLEAYDSLSAGSITMARIGSGNPTLYGENGGRISEDALVLGDFDLQLLSVAPMRSIIEPFAPLRRSVITIIAGAIAIGTIAVYRITTYHYRPLKRLVALTGEHPPARNEFDVITESLNRLVDQKTELTEIFQAHGREMRNTYLAGLLKGSRTIAIGTKDQLRAFRLVLVNFERTRESIELLTPFLARAAIDSYIRETGSSMEWIEIDGHAVLLQRYGCTGTIPATDEVRTGIQQLQNTLQHDHGVCTTFVVGTRQEGGAKVLQTAYAQCLKGVEYRFLYGPGSVIMLENLPEEILDDSLSIDSDLDLYRAIRSGNSAEATALVVKQFDTGNEAAGAGLYRSRLRAYTVIGVVMKAMAGIPEVNGGRRNLHDRITADAELVLRAATYPEMAERTCILADRAARWFHGRQESHNTDLNTRIVAFIHDHLVEPALCVAMIAHHFGMNSKYLARFFREQNAIGVSEFITERRLDEAITLLRKGATVKNVAESVGFGHQVTFIRLFKKREGITPGKYARIKII